MAKVKPTKIQPKNYVFAVGRRREAVARVRLYDRTSDINGTEYQKGDVLINGVPFGTYFNFSAYTPYFKRFFDATNALSDYIYSAKVVGGGKKGQLEAVFHGIARALDKIDSEKYHSLLREAGYLTRDARIRERRKVGMGGKARRKKQSPKR